MTAGSYIVDDPKAKYLNRSIIHIERFVEPPSDYFVSPIAEDSRKSRRYVIGTVEISKEYNNIFSKAPYKEETGSLGDNAYVFDSKDKKSTLLVSGVKGLFGVIIKPCPTKEGGRRRKTLRNKRKLRLRKTKSANKRR